MRSDHIGAVAALVASLSAAGGQDRTAAALRALSPADAYHSTLFVGLGGDTRILDRPANVHLISDFAFDGRPAPSPKETLAYSACRADAVLSGIVTDETSHPTSDGGFLFTNYTIKVVDIFRRGTGGAIGGRTPLTLVRPGGRMVVDGTTLHASSNVYPSLTVGTTYYLMVRLIRKTGALLSAHEQSTFQLSGTTVTLLGEPFHEPLSRGAPVKEFEGTLRSITCREE